MMSVTPASAQAAISLSRMAREALAMSVCSVPTPWQKRLRPADEPPDSTTGVGNSKFSPKASATIEAYGRTVDEPATWTLSRADAAAAETAVIARAEAVSFTKDMIGLLLIQIGSLQGDLGVVPMRLAANFCDSCVTVL